MYVCVCACVMCTPAHMWRKGLLCTLVFETGPLTDPGTHQLGVTGQPMSYRDLPVSDSHSMGVIGTRQAWVFFHGSWGSNRGLMIV